MRGFKRGGGETEGSTLVQTSVRSNPKAETIRGTEEKDIYGVQEPSISLLRQVVLLFDRGTLVGLSPTDSRARAYTAALRADRLGSFPAARLKLASEVVSPTPLTEYGVRASRTVRSGYTLTGTSRQGVRILGPNGRGTSMHNFRYRRSFATESQGGTGDTGSAPESMQQVTLAEIAATRNEETNTYNNLFPLIASEHNLLVAWLRIKNKSGNLTPEGSDETLDGLSASWFREASQKLLKACYTYTPARRVEIPKGPGGTRPLTVANPRDKIIQQAFLQVLQPLWEGGSVWKQVDAETYEGWKQEYTVQYPQALGRSRKQGKHYVRDWLVPPRFLNSSHGFRPLRGVHTALKEMKSNWGEPNWMIKFDVKQPFDNVNHHVLINEVRKVVDDQRVIDELYRMLKAKIVHFQSTPAEPWEPGVGTPQGSVLSPFLFNVYMHRLDDFTARLSRELAVPSEKAATPEYTSARYQIRKELDASGASLKQRLRAFTALRRKFRRSGRPMYEHRVRPQYVQYCRYADDFILGVTGSKDRAAQVASQITGFLKSDLHLTVSKHTIYHARSDKCPFLGFRLSIGTMGPRVKGKTVERFEKLKARTKHLRKMEYVTYLRMLKEAEKRFWVRSLESEARKAHQSMMGKLQLMKHCAGMARERILDSLISLLQEERAQLKLDAPVPAPAPKNDNPRLAEARELLDSRWSRTVQRWVTQAKSVVRVVPEQEAELFDIIGESKLAQLSRARLAYHEQLDRLDHASARKGVVSYVVRKHTNTVPGARAGGNAAAKTACEFSRTRARATLYLEMPYADVIERLTLRGYIVKGKPASRAGLTSLPDATIITQYTWVARGIWNFYACADNKWQLVSVINWFLRQSLLKTLAHKHSLTLKQTIDRYTNSPEVWLERTDGDRALLAKFLTPLEVSTREKTLLSPDGVDPAHLTKALNVTWVQTSLNRTLYARCAVKGCQASDIQVHHVRSLVRRFKGNVVSVITGSGRTTSESSSAVRTLISSLRRKHIPLCTAHHVAMHSGKLTPQDLDEQAVHPATLYLNSNGSITPLPEKF